jgi:hypothetical protein
MSSVLMHVYYDKNGDIKAISPSSVGELDKSYSYALLPFSDVEPFILGKRNTAEYMIKKTVTLSKKYLKVNLTRSMDNYLAKVSTDPEFSEVVKIVVNTKQKMITLLLNSSYKDIYEIGTEDERDKMDGFIKSNISHIYITEKNNPYSLLESISFLPKDLFESSRLEFKYHEDLDLSSSSAYTKGLMSTYQYVIKG